MSYYSKLRKCHIYCLIVMTFLVLIGVYIYSTLLTTDDLKDAIKAEHDVALRFSNRRLLIEKKCSSSTMPQNYVAKVAGHVPANVTLCVVPKAACSIWLRLFTYLNNKDLSNKPITAYSKFDIFFPSGRKFKRFNFTGKDIAFISRAVRVLTARDPYTRLWSAYIDKLLLPDFWFGKGKDIIKSVRNNATSLAKSCGNDVTFPEFVRYVLTKGHYISWDMDNHWLPITQICDPCIFKPYFIMKQETFLSDFKYVLDYVDLLQTEQPALELDQDEFEIKTEIDYNFRLYRARSKCIIKFELAKRIWTAMKLNGYLQPGDEFLIHPNTENISTATMVAMVRSARKRSSANKTTKKAFRKQALKDAYRQLSTDQLEALQNYYRFDFEMFGYDNYPPV